MITKGAVLQRIDDDIIWRKRELSSIKLLVEKAEKGQQSGLIRAALCLLYAHWEGYVKCAGTHYLQYVCELGKSPAELKDNFVAIRFLSQLKEAAKSSKPSTVGDVIAFISKRWQDRLRIQHKNIIDTQSNLSSGVLQEILWILGTNSSPFQTKFNLIDSSLVNRRNHIAHGQYLDIDRNDYENIHEEVLALLETFRNELQNALANDDFLRA